MQMIVSFFLLIKIFLGSIMSNPFKFDQKLKNSELFSK